MGKSALLRQLALTLGAAFHRDGKALPICVSATASSASVMSRIEQALGSETLPRSHVEALLGGGDLILIADGITEGDLRPDQWADFVRSAEAAAMPIVVAGRPSRRYRRELFAATPSGVIVRPDAIVSDRDLLEFAKVASACAGACVPLAHGLGLDMRLVFPY